MERAKAKASSKGVPKFAEVSKRDRILTPPAFRDLLLSLSRSCIGWKPTQRTKQVELEVSA